MSLNKNQITDNISNDVQSHIFDLFKKVTNKTSEFEFIFFSKGHNRLNKEKYVQLLKYLKGISKAKKIQMSPPERSLDFGYTSEESTENTNVYRISVNGSEKINKILSRLNEIQNVNYVIYKYLMNTIIKDDMSFLLKMRNNYSDTIDIDNLNIRARHSQEIDLIDRLKNKKSIEKNIDKLFDIQNKIDVETRNVLKQNIFFRLKERTSLFMEKNENYFIRIDLTDTKTSKNLQTLNSTSSNYELELEYGLVNGKPEKEHLDKMYSISDSLMKFIQQSSYIITNEQINSVLQYYKSLMNISDNIHHLVARQPVSLEIQHVTEIMPNRYTVTDKADGDRYFLVIFKNKVYFISTNLNVKDTGIVLNKKLEHYNGTVMDGEYIYLPKEKRHLYMTFDCLRNGETDIRQESSLIKRLEQADKIIEDCFVFEGQKGWKSKPVPSSNTFDSNTITKFYGQELAHFHSVLNEDIQKVKEYPLIRRKYFMSVFGAERWELFKYSVEYWTRYAEDASVKFPYLLDGLMYHPLEQAYVTNVNESKYSEFKWKPPVKNSIDFYIEFKKDPQTGKILEVYDNSQSNDNPDQLDDDNLGTVRNKSYRICTLYVGKMVDGKEVPTPFIENYGISEAYIYQRDGEIRDSMGDIITDKTVVEFYYQNDTNIIPQRRWIPIKTRYDKTESVEKFQRRYGNNSHISEKIWRSIINPVLMDDFIELAKGNTPSRNFYDLKTKEMNSKISHKLIVAVNRENKYYQKITRLASTMRQFHNFIKSNLIYTYFGVMYNDNKSRSIMDFGSGRFGDGLKYYYAGIDVLYALDIDENGFTNPVDGAISRYNFFKKSKPRFFKAYFIQADVRALLNYEAQNQALGSMSSMNEKLLKQYFSAEKKAQVDIINSQFAMHYFLNNATSWSNFKQNLNEHLRTGGFFVATTFDAEAVIRLLGTKDNYVSYYDDSDGKKIKFYEIKKQFDVSGQDIIGVGNAIDVHMSWISEDNTYITEYLVDRRFLIKEFEQIGLELVDTDLFQNQLAIQNKFLTESMKYESVEETKQYMAKVAQYYEDNEMNNKCKEYTNLHRYYIFRKRSKDDYSTGKQQKGGKINKKNKESNDIDDIQKLYNFSDPTKFKVIDMNNYDHEHTFVNSIHKLLASHSIIPKYISVEEFMKDMKLDLVKDDDLTNEYLQQVCNKIAINNEIVNENETINIINGLNIIIVERDCNNFYDIDYVLSNKNKNQKAIILMKEGPYYKPLLTKTEKGYNGFIKKKDEMIVKLLENGSKLE